MNGARFWSGAQWVDEYLDAARHDVSNGEQLRAIALKINATCIVADYGTSAEKRIYLPWSNLILK